MNTLFDAGLHPFPFMLQLISMRSTRSLSEVSSISAISTHSSSSLLSSIPSNSEKINKVRPQTAPLLATARKRCVHLTVAAIVIGFLIANVLFRLSVLRHPATVYQSFQHYLSDQLTSHRPQHPTDDLPTGFRPTVVALVSFNIRSRTEILDCYLQQNLVRNGGLIDRVIFSPETDDAVDLDWLRQTVSKTDGYNVLNTGPVEAGLYDGLEEKTIPLDDSHAGSALARSWVFADALAKLMTQSEDQVEPLFLFIGAETIYLSPNTIPSMLNVHQTQPEYSVIQANVVNQETLSWVHNKMNVVKPYRPDYLPIVTADNNAPGDTPDPDVFEGMRHHFPSSHIGKRDSPWKASELPLWADEASTAYTSQDEASNPLIFEVPIDLQPPAEKTRWLPFDARQAEASSLDFRHRPAVSSHITQKTLVANGPGRWPWTLSTQQLYSFLEHLEEEHDLSQPGKDPTTTLSSKTTYSNNRGLARYRFPLWSFDSEPIALSVFLISSSDLIALTASPQLFSQNAGEAELGRWILRQDVQKRLNDRTAVVDGHVRAARYASRGPGLLESSDEIAYGLDSTDLLERFRAYGHDVGCKPHLH